MIVALEIHVRCFAVKDVICLSVVGANNVGVVRLLEGVGVEEVL